MPAISSPATGAYRSHGDPPDRRYARFIIGHHLYRSEQGDVLRRAADFELTGGGSRTARSTPAGWPAFPATRQLDARARFSQTSATNQLPHRRRSEFLYRQREKGASVHHSGALIAIYSSGGLSWTRRRETYDEWKAVLGRYGSAEPRSVSMRNCASISKARRSASRATAMSRPQFRLEVAALAQHAPRHGAGEAKRIVLRQLDAEQSGSEDNPWRTTAALPALRRVRISRTLAFFDTRYYLLTHEDARRSDMLPILFYARHGAARGDATTPWVAQLWAEIATAAPSGASPLLA